MFYYSLFSVPCTWLTCTNLNLHYLFYMFLLRFCWLSHAQHQWWDCLQHLSTNCFKQLTTRVGGRGRKTLAVKWSTFSLQHLIMQLKTVRKLHSFFFCRYFLKYNINLLPYSVALAAARTELLNFSSSYNFLRSNRTCYSLVLP